MTLLLTIAGSFFLIQGVIIMDRILTVKNISKSYKIGNAQVHALKSTTLEIKKGEIVVVIGKSGSGKSTLLNVLGGLIVPDSGEVLLDMFFTVSILSIIFTP